GYAYRTSTLQRTPVICVRARFHGEPGDRPTAVRRIKEMANERIAKQPLAQPNTGSIFRNPPGDHAGRLIEAAGLKGTRIGYAVVMLDPLTLMAGNPSLSDEQRALARRLVAGGGTPEALPTRDQELPAAMREQMQHASSALVPATTALSVDPTGAARIDVAFI